MTQIATRHVNNTIPQITSSHRRLVLLMQMRDRVEALTLQIGVHMRPFSVTGQLTTGDLDNPEIPLDLTAKCQLWMFEK